MVSRQSVRDLIEALPRLIQAPSSLCARNIFSFYVDLENGSDETGDGSRENPFRSKERMRAVCMENGYCIIDSSGRLL
jgi:hypothetical protein